MSIAIIGGNECMERRYIDMCKQFNHNVKIFTKPKGINSRIGSPDLVVFFTNTMSHKMIRMASSAINSDTTKVIHSRSSSVSSLKNILEAI